MKTLDNQWLTIGMALTMRSSLLLAIISGILLGIWPFFLDRSGLSTFSSPTAFCLFQSVVLLFFTYFFMSEGGWKIPLITIFLIVSICGYMKWRWDGTKWLWVMIASMLSGTGLITLTKMMDITPVGYKGVFLATIFAFQILTSMGIHVVINPGDIGWAKISGAIFILAGTFLIHKKGPGPEKLLGLETEKDKPEMYLSVK